MIQRLNPLLECIRNVGKEFGDIVPDFQVGRTTCVLYLRYVWDSSLCRLAERADSLKYHRLHPEYIHQRIERLGHSYSLRILLLLCDIVSVISFLLIGIEFTAGQSEHQDPIRELTKVSHLVVSPLSSIDYLPRYV
jgi:DNA excision repair protein ERCC-1